MAVMPAVQGDHVILSFDGGRIAVEDIAVWLYICLHFCKTARGASVGSLSFLFAMVNGDSQTLF